MKCFHSASYCLNNALRSTPDGGEITFLFSRAAEPYDEVLWSWLGASGLYGRAKTEFVSKNEGRKEIGSKVFPVLS
jgi:hypothetical protein